MVGLGGDMFVGFYQVVSFIFLGYNFIWTFLNFLRKAPRVSYKINNVFLPCYIYFFRHIIYRNIQILIRKSHTHESPVPVDICTQSFCFGALPCPPTPSPHHPRAPNFPSLPGIHSMTFFKRVVLQLIEARN